MVRTSSFVMQKSPEQIKAHLVMPQR